MTAYYSEIDPFSAQWLRNLISAGHIAPGEVDERSIEEVSPSDLRGFTQCHFFAGIGIWSYALRQAGWPDDKPVWTGSCPCQPFSTAGKGLGFTDERHLWPAWHWLISQSRPSALFGEQVSKKPVWPWIDLVQADLEGLGYAFGGVPFPAAGVGAPTIRERAYWVAHAGSEGLQERIGDQGIQREAVESHERKTAISGDIACGVANSSSLGLNRIKSPASKAGRNDAEKCSAFSRMADSDSDGWKQRITPSQTTGHRHPTISDGGNAGQRHAGPTDGFWRDVDWLRCTDGKWRPVEPGTFPLANGHPGRVGQLRAYGNALNAQAAIAFIQSAMESI